MKIIQASVTDAPAVATLFDKYRQFYKQAPNYDGCLAYLQARLENRESTVFLALDDDGTALGFTQLYDSFCSVAMRPIVYLYDLYVDEPARRQGVGEALMARAEQYAREQKASRLTLETGIENQQPVQGSLWTDFNSDGLIDLFVGFDLGVSVRAAHGCTEDHARHGSVAAELGAANNFVDTIRANRAGADDFEGVFERNVVHYTVSPRSSAAASCTAARILSYPVQRQRLPASQ